MTILEKIWRGCGSLPHVGEHPGTLWVCLFILMGACTAGWLGALGMSVFFLPLYFYGAYERTNDSERFEEQEKQRG